MANEQITDNQRRKSPSETEIPSDPEKESSTKTSNWSEDRAAANVAHAKRRNRERLNAADASDRLIAGEYRSSSGRGEGGIKEKRGKKREHLTNEASDYFDKPAT